MSATQVLWRLTWKEYRVQRNLWWAILIMTVMLDALIVCTLAIMDRPPMTAAGHVVIVFGAVAVYLLGCGATLFSLEHEQGTFEFQRLLPTTAGQVYLAKMGLAMASGLALWGCLSLFALLLAALMPTTGQLAVRPSDWGAGVVTFLEIFLWAVFFSLLIR